MSIISEEAYAASKMSYGGSWQEGDRVLPRSIKPSDVDMVFDNNGCVLYGELDRDFNSWVEMLQQAKSGFATVKAYQSMVRKGDVHCAVLCLHAVKPEDKRVIDTRTDVIAFQAMVFHWQSFRVSRVISGNEHWQNFVFAWLRNPYGLRGEIIERSNIFQTL